MMLVPEIDNELMVESLLRLFNSGKARGKVKEQFEAWGQYLKDRSKDNKILLGYSDLSYEDPILLPIPKESITGTTLSQRGDGKTFTTSYLVLDQLVPKMNLYSVILDPKGDFPDIDKPMKDFKLLSVLRKLGKKPYGFDCKYLYPKFSGDLLLKGKGIGINILNIELLRDVGEKLQALIELFGIEKTNSTSYLIASNIAYQPFPTNLPDLEKAILEEMKNIRKTRGDRRSKVSGKVLVNFKSMVNMGVIVDDKKDGVNFPQYLASVKNLIIQTTQNVSNNRGLSAFLYIALKSITADRYRFVQSKGIDGVLERGVFFLVEEADKLIPREVSTGTPTAVKGAIRDLYTKDRQLSVSAWVVTQKPNLIDDVILGESGWILTTKLRDEKTKAYVREKTAMPSAKFRVIMNDLEYKPFKKPKQWALILGDDWIPFYPSPPPFAIKMEQH